MNTIETTEEERVLELAEKMKLIIAFAATLIPDIDLLERLADNCEERESYAYSAAPILGALGQDFQEVADSFSLRGKRAKSLLKFVRVLYETEKERTGKKEKNEQLKATREEFMRIFR